MFAQLATFDVNDKTMSLNMRLIPCAYRALYEGIDVVGDGQNA